MTVAELIAELSKCPQGAEVGELDEQGRFYPVQELAAQPDADGSGGIVVLDVYRVYA